MPPEYQESDIALLQGLKEGKRECYEALYNRYAQPIYRFIYSMVHQKEAAEDLVQEVFFKLYRSAHSYEGMSKFSTWLYQIAKNLTLNHLRDEKRTREQSVSLSDFVSSSKGAIEIERMLKDEQLRPDEAADQEAMTEERLKLIKIVKDNLARLSDRDRQLITLCAINEISQKEAAEILNCSVLSVKVGLYRARKRLAQLIGINPKKLGEL